MRGSMPPRRCRTTATGCPPGEGVPVSRDHPARATAAACSVSEGQILGRRHQLLGVVDQLGDEALHSVCGHLRSTVSLLSQPLSISCRFRPVTRIRAGSSPRRHCHSPVALQEVPRRMRWNRSFSGLPARAGGPAPCRRSGAQRGSAPAPRVTRRRAADFEPGGDTTPETRRNTRTTPPEVNHDTGGCYARRHPYERTETSSEKQMFDGGWDADRRELTSASLCQATQAT
jgi:hypothetical protein